MTILELSEARAIREEKLIELLVPGVERDRQELPIKEIDSTLTDASIEASLEEYLRNRTILDLAGDTTYPVNKLMNYLGVEITKVGYTRPLTSYGVTEQDVERAIRLYKDQQSRFMWNIVALGMIIVFVALAITGIAVALLEYFHRLDIQRTRAKTAPEQPETLATDTSEISASELRRRRRVMASAPRKHSEDEPTDAHSIAAIAAAIRLHEASIEEANRILVTWKRASVSMWKANRSMPNGRFFETKRR
jgi:hypothetical protein